MNIINPATKELILSLTEDSSDVLTAKFNLLKTHQPNWNSIVLSERVIILNLFADLLRQHVDSMMAPSSAFRIIFDQENPADSLGAVPFAKPSSGTILVVNRIRLSGTSGIIMAFSACALANASFSPLGSLAR